MEPGTLALVSSDGHMDVDSFPNDSPLTSNLLRLVLLLPHVSAVFGSSYSNLRMKQRKEFVLTKNAGNDILSDADSFSGALKSRCHLKLAAIIAFAPKHSQIPFGNLNEFNRLWKNTVLNL